MTTAARAGEPAGVTPDLDQLYTAYKAGRPRAEDRLAAEVWRRVHGVLRMRGACEAEAEEFAQQITARIMRNFQAKAVEEPSRYVARAATMGARDMGRRRATRSPEIA
ncbi:MAG: hypothetical protein KC613_16990, partial [Myxococcales bacterium]|nr:hypothetical protein [Myxococcales bacterium]